jgi:predicted transglutaminase-like cysteine proteinase
LFRASESIGRAAEPFGLLTSTLSEGGLTEKWRNVERKLEAELLALNLCEDSRTRCPSQAALQFLAIVDNAKARDKRARLGEINRAFNLAIKAENDLALYGEEDVRSPPLASLAIGAGDCEDYAIAKFVALG